MSQLDCAEMATLVTAALQLPADAPKGSGAAATLVGGAEAAEQHAAVEHAEHSEHAVNLGVALVLGLLLVALVIGHALEIRHVKALHEAGGALLVGVVGGAVLRWSGGEGGGVLAVTHAAVLGVARFDEKFFFFVLLPPIILEAGYNMQRRKFFQNIGAICMYAFIGTLMSTAVIAGVLYGSVSTLVCIHSFYTSIGPSSQAIHQLRVMSRPCLTDCL
jgi:hypothetical protein